MLKVLREDISELSDPVKAAFFPKFFKTGNGEYGEGDIFCGLTVPNARKIAKKYVDLPQKEVLILLHSKIHEERLIALLILVLQFQNGDSQVQKKIFDLYLANTRYINNWDLVDLTASRIVGYYLKDRDRAVLYQLAGSSSLWERRISIIATLYFIVISKEYKDTFAIADILLHDTHDLIHKAVGWMLREVGKRVTEKGLEIYLQPRYKIMPRTMLRYAIERFPQEKRKKYLHGEM
jgi:3-methyladenine DNA glycosylase AlkD